MPRAQENGEEERRERGDRQWGWEKEEKGRGSRKG